MAPEDVEAALVWRIFEAVPLNLNTWDVPVQSRYGLVPGSGSTEIDVGDKTIAPIRETDYQFGEVARVIESTRVVVGS